MGKSYSRWLKDNELVELRDIKLLDSKDTEYEVSGISLGKCKNELIVDTGLSHNLIIGATGSGKTQSTVLPMINLIARSNESLVLKDSSGELYRTTANLFKEKGYNIVVLDFKDYKYGNHWNPLLYPYQLYKNGEIDVAIELLEDLAHALLNEEINTDPFWTNTAADYFTGLALSLFKDGKEEEINLSSISAMISEGEERFASSTYAKKYFDNKDKNDASFASAAATVYAPTETRGSIISVLRQKIKLYTARQLIEELLSTTDFDVQKLNDKTVVYLITSLDSKAMYPLTTAFIKQMYNIISSLEPKKRVNFILDDFDELPAIKDLNLMLTSSRSRNIRFNLIIKSYRGLYEVYGKEISHMILNSFNTIIYLLTNDHETAEFISKLCGEKEENVPLISVEELLRLNYWETIVLKMRCYPLKTKLIPNYQIEWNDIPEEAELNLREKNDYQRFSLKEVVAGYTENLLGIKKDEPVNVDELVAKIDQKIEELEREEKAKEEAKENKMIIDKTVKRVEIEKNRVIIYY